MVLLIGNYASDRQQSMQRFGRMMLQGLTAAGIEAELIAPQAVLGKSLAFGRFVRKWLGYVDKYLMFPFRLKKRLSKRPDIVHICDHSNAVYVEFCANIPVIVTCHDLLAVRGALGEETDCPASITGRFLQRWIMHGLRNAGAVICSSQATAADAERIVMRGEDKPRTDVVLLGLNYPYQQQPVNIARDRLASIPGFEVECPFVLHVGSNLRRKNREGVLRIFARIKDRWSGRLIFAGDSLTPELCALAKELRIFDRITQVSDVNDELLEALYSCAVALLYPSRFEGFGWPIIEAHACGCPVLCSKSGPLPEVAGEAGLFRDVDDEEGFASDLLRLSDPLERRKWSEKSLANAQRFSTRRMVEQYLAHYRKLGARL